MGYFLLGCGLVYFFIGDQQESLFLDAIENLDFKKQEYDERKLATDEAKKVAEIEFSRLKSGKTTVNSYIDSEGLSFATTLNW